MDVLLMSLLLNTRWNVRKHRYLNYSKLNEEVKLLSVTTHREADL